MKEVAAKVAVKEAKGQAAAAVGALAAAEGVAAAAAEAELQLDHLDQLNLAETRMANG